jgi:hypothetical protein
MGMSESFEEGPSPGLYEAKRLGNPFSGGSSPAGVESLFRQEFSAVIV